MTKTRQSRLRRPAAASRAVGAVGALLVAAAVGVGSVVGTAALVGPTNSDSGPDGVANQAAPTVSLPANETPQQALPDLDPAAPVPTPDGLQQALAGPMSDPALGQLGLQVLDPATGTVLLAQDAAAPMQPGSTIKLYTAAAAAAVLDPGARITTTVVRGANPTEITVVAGGDPTLSSEPESTYYPGAATIQQLAEEIKAAGVGAVTKITVDGSVFAGPATAPGWGSGDAPSTYAAPIQPFMVDGGRSVPDDDASMRYGEPDLQAAQLLADALGSADAQIVRGTAGPGDQPIAAVESAPIEQLIEQMVLISDNTLAECLGRLVAIELGQEASFAGAVEAITATMLGLGVDLTGYTGFDASGLSTDNRTSAQSTGSLMALVAGGAHPRLDVLSSALAVSGYNGTLATRFESGVAGGVAGRVRGKTGTLTGVSSLAGTVLTNDGRVLVYSFISNGGAATVPTRAALDEIAAAIAGCGCR